MAHIDIHRSRDEATEQPSNGTCACGGHDESLPELDVQTIPHAIRHAAIFGALESLHVGGGIIISATHNPLPLLEQLRSQHADKFETEYLDEGPERWRLFIRRNA